MINIAPEVKILVTTCQKLHQRALIVITGDELYNQVMVLHHLIAKEQDERPSIVWCHKKDSDLPSRSRKLMKRFDKKLKSGIRNLSMENAFELFLISTPIKYCSLSDTTRLLGNTFGMAVIQDFQALMPNALCRIIETVEGGGLVVFLFLATPSLRDVFDLEMDVHSKLRTYSHSDVIPLFNERFVISLSWCKSAMVLDGQLCMSNQLEKMTNKGYACGTVTNKKVDGDVELENLKALLIDADKPLPQLANLCCTVDQAKAVLKMIDVITDKGGRATVSLTAGRGRGKSAALGLGVAAAIHFGINNIFVVTPSPENLKSFFSFVFKGFDALGYSEDTDYEIVQSTNPEFHEAIVRVNVFHKHKQVIQYLLPSDVKKLKQAELVVIDEAAAIPLLYVKSMIGPHNVFMASTINGYEGTGRSLSLKLLQQLRKQSIPIGAKATSAKSDDLFSSCRPLHEISLESSIRYAPGDPIELWLHRLLCLDAPSTMPSLSTCPAPHLCDLYYVNRDVLFSGHRDSESFLNQMLSLLVASHYRNSPDDLQVMSDAPAHHLFVLLSPITSREAIESPSVLTVIQASFEGGISKTDAKGVLSRGERPSGDLVPWVLAQQFLDHKLPQKRSLRIVRIATHSEYQSMGYGYRAIKCLKDYYLGRLISVDEPMDLKTASVEENDTNLIGPRKTTQPLLSKLSERNPEDLEYISVSFGLTLQLFKFWKKVEFLPVYISQVANKVTGEHNCIMVHLLGTEDEEEVGCHPKWMKKFSKEFVQRFSSLLGGPLRNLPPTLASQILSSHKKNLPKAEVSWNDLQKIISSHDLQRLKVYSKNLADRRLITDLLPYLASLYFTQRLPRVELSELQSPMLVCVGLQGSNIEALIEELELPIESILGQFNRALRKFVAIMTEIQECAISSQLPDPQSEAPAFTPVSLPLLSELNDGYKEFEAKEDLQSNVMSSLRNLNCYQIKGDGQDWEEALKNSKDTNILSIKSTTKRQRLTDAQLEQEIDEERKMRNSKSKRKKKGVKKFKR